MPVKNGQMVGLDTDCRSSGATQVAWNAYLYRSVSVARHETPDGLSPRCVSIHAASAVVNIPCL